MHKLLSSEGNVAALINKSLKYSHVRSIVDLCSGSGGPMINVLKTLTGEYGLQNVTLTLTDLYPNNDLAKKINTQKLEHISYLSSPVDATNVPPELPGIRTMICSFHHMDPRTARSILTNAKESRQPICIYEISDNSFPVFLWWLAIPLNFVTALFITPLVRPLTGVQMLFTYLIPIIPLVFAWDGAVSNARTYTLNDLDLLLEGLETNDYKWEKGHIEGRSKKLFLIGNPIKI